jgi:hypothetical protein
MAKKRDNAMIITGVIIGAGLIGSFIYFASKPASAQTAAAKAPPNAPATYAMQFSDGANIALKVGDTLRLDVPHPAAPGTGWGATVNSPGLNPNDPNGAAQTIGGDANSVLIRAIAPGSAQVQLNLVDQSHGAGIEGHTMYITVT